MNKNIAFYIYSKRSENTGRGGMYYSLLVYKRKLGEKNFTSLIHFNELVHNTVLDNDTDLLIRPTETLKTRTKRLQVFFEACSPDVLISFSNNPDTLMLRAFCLMYGCKFIFVKPGGRNKQLAHWYTNVIFFSKENFQSLKGKRCKNAFLLSNRVELPQKNVQRLHQSASIFKGCGNALKVLRVSRISNAYLDAFLVTINLHKKLQQENVNVVTHLIGYIEDEEAFEILSNEISDVNNIFILTEDKITMNANELIPLYDIVVGVGRGFWEAVACNKFVLGYAKNSKFPVLVTQGNIEVFKEYNCSLRVSLDKFDLLTDDLNIYFDDFRRNQYIKTLVLDFEENFSVELLDSKIKRIINACDSESPILLISSILQFFIKSIGKIIVKPFYKIRKRSS